MKIKKRFSIRNKLVFIFGFLVLAAGFCLGLAALVISKRAVAEKVETHLTDKATDTAEIIDGRITAVFQFIEGIARMPILLDPDIPYTQKTQILNKEAKFNDHILELNITDTGGRFYSSDHQTVNVKDRMWFQSALSGQKFLSEPYIEKVHNNLVLTFAVPIYNNERTVVGVISADIDGFRLAELIQDITVGTSGGCYILGLTGTIIAHKEYNLIVHAENHTEHAKTDSSFQSVAAFEQKALSVDKSEVGHYEYKGVFYIASYATIKTTGWTVIIRAPAEEFMGTIQSLRISMYLIEAVILLVALGIVFVVARTMIKPIEKIASALKDIAQGEGDLTVRLPVNGNDEVTDLSQYFNQTIEKIRSSIQTIDINADTMLNIGENLASSMTETATAVNQISANIDGVKKQTINQAASVTETAATVEEIIRTIKQLNSSIENQAASVEESSSAIEQMVSNIASITQTLEKTDGLIKTLASATAEGKDTVASSNSVTQRIAEESGGLLEASSVIQHIAGQTNLLAMNAAIEAAHAGEAGKGFAVVADEIRKLAEESSVQGKTITATLKTLSGEIDALSVSSKTAEEKFNVIFKLSEQVRDMSNRLMEAMHEQEHGSKEVLTAIRDINTVTSQVKDGSTEMLTGGENVAQEMHKLDGLTRVITDSMNEMASGTMQINNAVEEVSVIAQKNKTSIENLSAEVNKFKIGNETKQRIIKKADIGIDLNSAIKKHVEWKVKLRAAISTHEKLDAETISNDSACEFGKWLYGDAKTKYKDLPKYIQCLEKHAVFHREAGKVASAINAGKFTEAEAMLNAASSFNTASSDVASAVKALKDEVGL